MRSVSVWAEGQQPTVPLQQKMHLVTSYLCTAHQYLSSFWFCCTLFFNFFLMCALQDNLYSFSKGLLVLGAIPSIPYFPWDWNRSIRLSALWKISQLLGLTIHSPNLIILLSLKNHAKPNSDSSNFCRSSIYNLDSVPISVCVRPDSVQIKSLSHWIIHAPVFLDRRDSWGKGGLSSWIHLHNNRNHLIHNFSISSQFNQ